MKRLMIMFVSTAVTAVVMAVPAFKRVTQQTTADGQVINVQLMGDEHCHYYVSEQGEKYELKHGVLQPFTATEAQHNARRAPQQTTIGDRFLPQRGLIILANYKDVKFQAENTLESMQEMHTGENYTYDGATGSVRQYFTDVSGGKYTPWFDVVGPVELDSAMAYYGRNVNGGDEHACDMVWEACKKAHDDFGVDFSQYDNNGDWFVDYVYVIYAGYSEATGGNPEECIWPHASVVWCNDWQSLDGVYLWSYACSSELQGTKDWGSARCGIGTFAHEFSHVMGLPDLYDTQYSGHKTLGEWDLMDAGCYNNNGKTPPAYSAYERWFMGWLTPEQIAEPMDAVLENLNDSQQAYLVTEEKTHNLNGVNPSPADFYLLENRQQTSWDTYLPGHGMLMTHIQYSSSKWENNQVNVTASAMGVDLVEADGKVPTAGQMGGYGKEGDLFPTGATEYEMFADKDISDVTEEDGVIRFAFMGGEDAQLYTKLNISLRGVEQLSGVTTEKILKGEDIQITLRAQEMFYPLTVTNTAVVVRVGDSEAGQYSFLDGILTIYIAGEEVTDVVTISVEATADPALVVCDNMSYEFVEVFPLGEILLGEEEWYVTMEGSQSRKLNTVQKKGIQLGSTSEPTTLALFEQKYASYCSVRRVRVNASCGAGATAQLSAFVDDTPIGEVQTLQTKEQEYVFEVNPPRMGRVQVRMDNTKRAMYIKSIVVEYGDDKTALPSIMQEGVQIIGEKDCMYVNTSSMPLLLKIYSLQGTLIQQVEVYEDCILPLHSGMYIVTVQQGDNVAAKKVIVY